MKFQRLKWVQIQRITTSVINFLTSIFKRKEKKKLILLPNYALIISSELSPTQKQIMKDEIWAASCPPLSSLNPPHHSKKRKQKIRTINSPSYTNLNGLHFLLITDVCIFGAAGQKCWSITMHASTNTSWKSFPYHNPTYIYSNPCINLTHKS